MIAAKPFRFLTKTQLEDLEYGDVFIGGKLVDCDGEEEPVASADNDQSRSRK